MDNPHIIEYDIAFFILDKKKLDAYPRDQDFIDLNNKIFNYTINFIQKNINNKVDTNALPKIPIFYEKPISWLSSYWPSILNKLKKNKPINKYDLLSIKSQMFFSKVSIFPYNIRDSDRLQLSFSFWINMGTDIYETFARMYDEDNQLGCSHPFEDFAKKNTFLPFEKMFETSFLKLNTCICEKMREKCIEALNNGIEDDILKNETYYFLDILEKVLSEDYVLCFISRHL